MEGYSGSPTNFNAITQIDSKTNEKYVDAMFFGHDHVYKSGFYNQVPYLETSGNAQKLGIMSLKLKADGDNYNVDVTNSTVNNIDAYNTCKTSDPNIDAIANKAEYKELIKSADETLYTFSKSYSKAQFAYVVCQAMLWFVNNNKKDFGNVTYYFASHNTGGVRESVSQGDFTRRDLVKTFPFDNLLSAQVCTSSNISYMESNSYYETYKENIVYSNGVTNAISITYITENSTYGPRCQQSYKNYNHTATDALVAYLLSGVNTSL
jgi:2',3'-cyclic-nucleotide 2'-phosphodiesterase (5'-nucleotidase family)